MLSKNELTSDPTLKILNLTIAGFSLIASIFMAYWCLKQIKKITISRVMLGIALSNCIYSVSNLMASFNNQFNGSFCIVEGFTRQFSSTFTIYFTTITAIFFYKSSLIEKRFNAKSFLNKAFWIGFLVCLALSLQPLFMEQITYGKDSSFCWLTYVNLKSSPIQLSASWMKLIIVLAFEGFPLCLGLLISLVGYLKAIKNSEKLPKEAFNICMTQISKLRWYSAFLYALLIPNFIYDIVQIYILELPLWLMETHVLVLCAVGLIISLIYTIQQKTYPKNLEINDARLRTLSKESELSNSMSGDLLAVQSESTQPE